MRAKAKKIGADILGIMGKSVVGLIKNPVTQTVITTVVKHKFKSGVAATLIVAAYEAFAGSL